MTRRETVLRRHARRYVETVDPMSVPGVLGICLTGSLAAGFVDELTDIDLTLVIDDEFDEVALDEVLLPPSATVQRRTPGEKYSFDWDGEHVDIVFDRFDDLRSERWDLQTRWEYGNAEPIVDPSGRVERRLESAVAFEDGEQEDLIEERADDFLFTAQWEVHKACRRGSFRAAHRAASRAADGAIALLFLAAGEFPPRDKWIEPGLEAIPLADEETRTLTWEAQRVLERDPEDLHRRVRALRSLWDRLESTLVEQGFIDPESHTWHAPPDELCLLD